MKKAPTTLGILLLAGTQAFAQTVTTVPNVNTAAPVVVSNYSPYQDPIFYGLIFVAALPISFLRNIRASCSSTKNRLQ